MNAIKRVLPWLSAACLVAVVLLSLAVWRQSRECERLELVRATRDAKLDALRQQAAKAAKKESPPAPMPPKAPPVAMDPATAEADRADRLVVEERAKQAFRRNALHSYIAGFDALQLPPATLARAKEIILAQWQAADDARKNVRSADEAVAVSRETGRVLDEQMTALIGAEAYVALKAATEEDSLDWTIGTDMWDGGAPLRPEQLRALALAQNRLDYQRAHWIGTPNAAQTPDLQTGLSTQDVALLGASEGLLSTAQQEILRQHLIEENRYNAAMRAFSEKQRRLNREQDAAGRN